MEEGDIFKKKLEEFQKEIYDLKAKNEHLNYLLQNEKKENEKLKKIIWILKCLMKNLKKKFLFESNLSWGKQEDFSNFQKKENFDNMNYSKEEKNQEEAMIKSIENICIKTDFKNTIWDNSEEINIHSNNIGIKLGKTLPSLEIINGLFEIKQEIINFSNVPINFEKIGYSMSKGY